MSSTESHVHYIDFGNQQTVDSGGLLDLPDDVWDIPPAAVPCRWVRPGMYVNHGEFTAVFHLCSSHIHGLHTAQNLTLD